LEKNGKVKQDKKVFDKIVQIKDITVYKMQYFNNIVFVNHDICLNITVVNYDINYNFIAVLKRGIILMLCFRTVTFISRPI